MPEPFSVAERLLHQPVKVLAPDLVVVAVAGILTPHVLHAGLRQRVVHGAAPIDRGVFGARADEDHLVVLVRLRRVGGEQVRGTESAERADVGKQFRMAEADGGAVTAAHRIAHDRAVILVFDDAELFLNIRNDVVEHLLLHAPTARGDAETPATGACAARRTSRRRANRRGASGRTTLTRRSAARARRRRSVPQRFLQREDLRLFPSRTVFSWPKGMTMIAG